MLDCNWRTISYLRPHKLLQLSCLGKNVGAYDIPCRASRDCVSLHTFINTMLNWCKGFVRHAPQCPYAWLFQLHCNTALRPSNRITGEVFSTYLDMNPQPNHTQSRPQGGTQLSVEKLFHDPETHFPSAQAEVPPNLQWESL